MNWSAPPEIADMHPDVDGWYRRGPWIKSRKGDHFEALYMRNGESRHVMIRQNVACDAASSLWAVRHVVKARRKSASRSRPGRRALSAARQGATGEDGTKPAKDARETTGDR